MLSLHEQILLLEQTVCIFKVKVGELCTAISLAKISICAPGNWLAYEEFVFHALCGVVQTHPSNGNPLLTRLSFLFELLLLSN